MVIATILIFVANAGAANLSLKKNQVAKVSGVTCGLVKNSWKVIKKSKKKYILVKNPPTAQRKICNQIVKPSKVNLANLPDAGNLVRSAPSTSAIVSANSIGSQSVSGTPPTLSEIITTGPSTIFWAPGVVSSVASGSPTTEQCNEFFNSSSDGSSGGFLSCYMTQSAGYALSEVVRSGTTMCYMKNMPTQEVFRAGGFRVTDGTLPGGNVANLFKTPSGSTPRIVRIVMSGDPEGESKGVIKVFSESQNASSGDQYKYEMVFCDGGSTTPQEVEKTRITSAGEFISSSTNNNSEGGNGVYKSTVRAFLRSEGSNLVFDNTRSRTATQAGTGDSPGGAFARKAQVTINGDNEITSKEFDIQGSDVRKAFSVSRFSGTGMSSMRFFEGAVKQTFSFGDFNGATEFRNSSYVAAPSNSYISALESVDLSTDSFYSGTPTVNAESASVRCNAAADIEITVDMTSDIMQSVTAGCEGERLDGVNFCGSSELQQALSNFNTSCFQG